MANSLITILDVTKRKGNDQEIGLLEDSLIYAPELGSIMGRPIVGTQFKTVHRGLPTVGFRIPNNGSDTIKSTYRQDLKECAFIDAQLQVDTALIDAEGSGGGPEGTIEDLQYDEAMGAIMGAYIAVGTQMYYGTNADANGFAGISALCPNLNAAKNLNPCVVGAGGTTASVQSSAYFIWENIRGAHFIFGKNRGIQMMPEWRIQQVLGQNSKPLTASVNNIQGWLGFAANHPLSVGRIGNINKATDSKPLTDALVAQFLSYLPLYMRAEVNANVNGAGPQKIGGGLKIMMNGITGYGLQASRTAVTDAAGGVDGAQRYPKLPQETNGVPIVYTDSIVNTEAVLT